MKKYYALIAFLLLIFSICSTAQVNYSFSATTATYVAVTGGTTPTLINRPFNLSGQYAPSYATGVANAIPIGFTFNYNRVDYTTINISANGFATLGSPFITDTNTMQNFYINSLKFGPIQYIDYQKDSVPESGLVTKPVLAPLWDDISAGANTDLRYTNTGIIGSRIFTFEWSNEKWQYDATSPVISFQLKLYEGSNVVEFCYKDEGGSPSAGASASIGITASQQQGGGFMSLQNTSASPTISTTTETHDIYIKPANDQVYRFTPLACNLPLNLHYDSYNNTSVNFSWTAPAGVSNFEYALNTSPDVPATGIATTATSLTVSSLSPGTKYYIHVRSYCSASSQSVWPVVSFTTTKNSSTPPPIAWQKSLGGSGVDFARSIKQTPDGGYIVAGSSNSNDGDVTGNHGGSDYWIVKLSSSGAIQWQKSIGGSGDDWIANIELTSDGGYIVDGSSYSNDGDVSGNHGDLDYWIVKLSDIGTIQWQKCLGGSGSDGVSYNKPPSEGSIKQTSDGGYIVAGVTTSNDGDVIGHHDTNGSVFDGWIVKLSSNGAILWQKCLGGSDYDEANSIRQIADGGYILSGFSESNDGDVIRNNNDYGFWIVKLNSSGIIQWQEFLGGDEPFSIEQTFDGGYIVAGNSNYNVTQVPYDLLIFKLNSNGDIQWQKNLGGSADDNASSVRQTSDGGYIIAGDTRSNDDDVNGNHGDNDYWIVKLSSDGTFQWQKCLGGSIGDFAFSIEPTTDGGYIVGGLSYSNDGDVSGNHGNNDVWVVKLSSAGKHPLI